MKRLVWLSLALWLGGFSLSLCAAEGPSEKDAARALAKAVTFFHRQVATHGGYVYAYSEDLTKREGEGKTDPHTVWVQPPGTPAVGLAYVDAYRRTGEPYLLEAAREAGECLIQGQLRSGCWTDSITFDPERRGKYAYRVDPPRRRGFNYSTYDDDKTQAALRFMMRLDQALDFKDPRVHEATQVALAAVLKSQFPNGGFPQGFESFPDPEKYPVKPASYPADWPRKAPGGDYWHYYTLNDGNITNLITTLLWANRIYGDSRYREAALKAGDFLLLAQMPDPQPAWAQQYNFEMQPVWARKFEPAAISGGESQSTIASLMELYVESGDRKYLAPIPTALRYLRKSVLPDGQLARFYELKTDKPLYFTRQYELTYDDGDLPTHYGFKVRSKLDGLAKEYERLAKLPAERLADRRLTLAENASKLSSGLAAEAKKLIAGLDERGAWVEDGALRHHGKRDDTRRIISSETFAKNLNTLSRYLAAVRAEK